MESRESLARLVIRTLRTNAMIVAQIGSHRQGFGRGGSLPVLPHSLREAADNMSGNRATSACLIRVSLSVANGWTFVRRDCNFFVCVSWRMFSSYFVSSGCEGHKVGKVLAPISPS